MTSAANPVVAMKGVQMVYALTQSDQGPFLTPSTLDALVLSLASRCVRLPLADPNQEQLMVLAVDALHGYCTTFVVPKQPIVDPAMGIAVLCA